MALLSPKLPSLHNHSSGELFQLTIYIFPHHDQPTLNQCHSPSGRALTLQGRLFPLELCALDASGHYLLHRFLGPFTGTHMEVVLQSHVVLPPVRYRRLP